MNTRLQDNSLGQLRRTLEDLSSTDRQRRYKEQAPFVHVPDELLAQWETHIRYLRETEWFRELFDTAQATAMERFDILIQETAAQLGSGVPDVPEIFGRAAWLEIGSEAEWLLKLLPEE